MEESILTVFSLEISASKNKNTWMELKQIRPAWIGIASHAQSYGELMATIKLAANIQFRSQIPVMPHLAARYLTMDEIANLLPQITSLGIKQLMIVRGDKIRGKKDQQDFKTASDLIAYVHQTDPQLNLTGACYPEAIDLSNLQAKIAAGCKQLTTQAFFDNQAFYNLQDKCKQAGIQLPIIAGIMPITSWQQVKWLTKIGDISLPKKLHSSLVKHQTDPQALRQIGLDYAAKQIADLVDHQVRGIHLFTMNDLAAAKFLLNDYC